MKRPILLILCFALAFSAGAASLSDSSSWIPDSVRIGTGNDKWTHGISRNDDDQLSYSGNIAVEAPAWKLSLDLQGITNRGWKDDYYTGLDPEMSPDNWYDGRYDLIDLRFALKTELFDSEHMSILFSPYIGLLFAGNFGFEAAQNLIHTISHIHLVNLPYDIEDVYMFPQLGASLSVEAQWKLEHLERTGAGFSADFASENAIGYEYSQYAGGSIFLSSGDTRVLRLSLGYEWIEQASDWKTHTLLAWYNRGWVLSFGLNAGALSLSYYTDIEHTFGYTTIMVDVMRFTEGSIWKKDDISFIFSMDRMGGRTFSRTGIQIPLSEGASVVLTNRYIAGNPLYSKEEEHDDLSYYFRDKLAYTQWLYGFRYDFPSSWCAGWLTFYGSFSVGLQTFMFSFLSNMVPDSNIPNADIISYAFVLDAEIGVLIFPETMLSAGNATYRLSLSAGVSAYPDAETAYFYMELMDSSIWHIPLLFRVSLGMQIGLDL